MIHLRTGGETGMIMVGSENIAIMTRIPLEVTGVTVVSQEATVLDLLPPIDPLVGRMIRVHGIREVRVERV